MNQNVELAEFLLERGKQSVDFGVVRQIALKANGAGQFGDEPFGVALPPLALVAENQSGAGLVELLGDAPGNGTLVGQPEDNGRSTRQIDHACFSSFCGP